MLSTAELLLGISRHLGTYAVGPDRAALGQLEFAGQVLELAIRLRGSGTSTGDRVAAIAVDAGIDLRRLRRDVLPTLQSLNLIEIYKEPDGRIAAVIEVIPPLQELLMLADSILVVAQPEPVEQALLTIVDITTRMPVTIDTAVEEGASIATEEAAQRAVGYLQALHLAARVRSADGDEVLFNPNVWSADVDYTAAALRAEDGAVRAALSDLIEEVATTAGLPQDQVTSADYRWIDYAVAQGLLLRSLVQTTTGEERAFLFTPHMGRSAFSAPIGTDPSGHVRQLIGSMMFARTYAEHQLYWPRTFLRKLVREGEAGDATDIGTDYPMLETAGIVRVEPGSRYYKFVLLQPDIAEEAITYLESGGGEAPATVGLRDQRKYRHPERERAGLRVSLAHQSDTSPAEADRLVAALRQEVGRRRYGR